MFHISKSKNINFAKIYKSGQKLLNEIPPIKERRRRKNFFKFLKYFNLSILILFLFVVIFPVCFLILKRPLEDALTGKSDLKRAAVKEPEEQNFKQAAKQDDIINDYLMVAEDSVPNKEAINRSIVYEVDQSASGFFSKLRVNYANHGERGQKATGYKTYIRAFAPLGSRLIKAEILPVDGVKPGGEARAQTQNESGKTSFGAFIEVKPGEIGGLYFEYKLPENFKLTENCRYELYIQKQSGNNADDLTVDLNFINDVQSYNPTGFYVDRIGNNRVKWESDLTMDKRYIIKF